MQRVTVLLTVVAFIVVGLVVGGRHLGAVAQEGTPAPEQTGLPEGVSFEWIASGRAEQVPAAPALFEILRLRLEPGAVFEVPADDPSLALPVLESGTVAVSITAPVVVSRALPAGAAGTPAAPEEIAAGTEFVLAPGDSFVGPPNSGGTFRNDGAEPAVFLIAHLVPEAA